MAGKRRITIPDDHAALILSEQEVAELKSFMLETRRANKALFLTPAHREVAGDIILAIVSATE